MPIYRLDPVEGKEDDPNWQASTLRSNGCWVRAGSKMDARQKVNVATIIATERDPRRPIATSPWMNPDLTICKKDEPGIEVPEGVVVTASGNRLPIGRA